MIKTRNGLFANQGWGGGVFNYNVAFGSVPDDVQGIAGFSLGAAKDLTFTPYNTGQPCGSPNTIKNVQFKIGTETDGIWGPLSQKAYNTLKSAQGTEWCDIVPKCSGVGPLGFGCSAVAAPQPAPQPAPSTPVEAGEDEDEDSPEAGTKSNTTLAVVVLGLVGLLGATIYLGRNTKK